MAVYGVLKAGGAFLPIDPKHPVERRAYIPHDSGARVIVTQPHLVDSLPEHDGTIVVIFPDFGDRYLSTTLWHGWQKVPV